MGVRGGQAEGSGALLSPSRRPLWRRGRVVQGFPGGNNGTRKAGKS